MSWEFLTSSLSALGGIYAVLTYHRKPIVTDFERLSQANALSLGMLHSSFDFEHSCLERHNIEISVFNPGSNKCLIHRIDWAIAGTNKKSSVKVAHSFPFLLPDEGMLIKFDAGEILVPQMNFENQSDFAKWEILKGLTLEVVFDDNDGTNIQTLTVCSSIKRALFRNHSKGKLFSWLYEKRL